MQLRKILNNYLISVIIPIYNAELYLKDTVDSVINQTYKNIEILMINHNSTDNSKKIIEEYVSIDNRIIQIDLNQNKGGPAYPRNIGINKSKGEFIAFLDSDDIWHKDKLKKQMDFIKDFDLNFTSSDFHIIDSKNKELNFNIIRRIYRKTVAKNSIRDLIKNNFIVTSSVLIKRDILNKFSEEKQYISVEDLDLWLRTMSIKSTKYKYQNEKLIKYRLLSNSASDRNNILLQELKSNMVLSSFLIDNECYISSWYYRIFFHTLRKYFKKKINIVLRNSLISCLLSNEEN